MEEIFRSIDINDVWRFGAIAQLVEHLHGMQGASGSSPLGSIEFHNRREINPIASIFWGILRELKDYVVLKINYYC